MRDVAAGHADRLTRAFGDRARQTIRDERAIVRALRSSRVPSSSSARVRSMVTSGARASSSARRASSSGASISSRANATAAARRRPMAATFDG